MNQIAINLLYHCHNSELKRPIKMNLNDHKFEFKIMYVQLPRPQWPTFNDKSRMLA